MHTPGPWAYDADSREIFADSDGFGWIALVKGNDSRGAPLPEHERLANANLIAAAPDLLELARQIVLAADDNEGSIPSDIVQGARKAISHATTED